MNFDVYGPIEIARKGNKGLITKESLDELAERLDEESEGLTGACGCYVFALRAGGSVIPWYVGQANKSKLVQESMNSSNREKYNVVLDCYERAVPLMYFLPLITPAGGYAKPTTTDNGRKSIDFLEDWLISTAIDKNPDLVNLKKTMLLRNLHVTGMFNAGQGEATKASTSLKRTLGL